MKDLKKELKEIGPEYVNIEGNRNKENFKLMMKKLSDVLTNGQIMRKFTQVESEGKIILKNHEKPIVYDGKNAKHKKKNQRQREMREDK